MSDIWRMTKQVRSNPSWVPEAQSKTLRTPQNVPAPTVCWPEGGTGPSVLQNLPFGPFFSSKIYTLHHHWLTHKSEEKKRKQVARRWLWGEVVMTPNEQALAGSRIFSSELRGCKVNIFWTIDSCHLCGMLLGFARTDPLLPLSWRLRRILTGAIWVHIDRLLCKCKCIVRQESF